jgi:penicillin-binding protein 1A
MSDLKKGTPRRRRGNTYTTKSGNTIKLNSSLSARIRARKDARDRRKAAYMSRLPRDRWKRMLFRLRPKELYHYWFSREGGIMVLKIIGFMIIAGAIFLVGLFAYFRKDLPNIKDISGDSIGGSITYYDSTGKTVLWQDYDAVKRIPVPQNQQPNYMRDATVATEDQNFYKEGAFNIKSIARAALDDASGSSGGGLQGGSTITQQLVKLNENWIGVETLARKIKEIILAVEVGREYSKADILTAYLNIAPYGGVEYGVQAAAQDYFQENSGQLTLAQSAFLAAIPKAPSIYSPYSAYFDKSAFTARYDYILGQMHRQGYISQSQETQALNTDVLSEVKPLESKYQGITAPYFVLAAKQQLDDTYGTQTYNRGGWKVITTLNTALQNDAQQDVVNNEGNVAAVGGDQEAMVAEDVKTGQVVAEVGGENFNNAQYGQINYADTNIQPGSSLKPFLYAALIQNNTDVGAGSVLYDTNYETLPGYPCTDKTEPTATSNGGNCLWDDNFVGPGPVTLRYALGGSRNIPAVKASYEIDPTDTSSDYTKSVNTWISEANAAIGVKDAYGCYPTGTNVETATAAQQTQCYGSAALGSGEVPIGEEVNGDVTLARLGAEIPQTYIEKITDAAGNTVYQWTPPKSTQVYKPDTAYIIDSILDDPKATYLQPYQKFQNYDGWDIAVKTGTENQEYNGVMTAWSTQYAVIGFVGYHTLDKPLEEGHFEDITEPITRTWMEQALTALHTKPVNWTQPAGIKSVAGYSQEYFSDYGAEFPGPRDDLYPSWYSGNSSGTKSETIDKVSGLLATSCTPTLAKETIDGYSGSSFSIDIFYPKQYQNEAALEAAEDGGSNIPADTATDNIHNCNDSPPSVTITEVSCDDTSKCDFTVAVTQGTYALSGGTYTATPAGSISLLDNGKVIQTISIPSSSSQSYNNTISASGINNGDTVSAQAVDSVLYSASSSTTAQVPSTGSGSSQTNQ